jgi:hypothetical protein
MLTKIKKYVLKIMYDYHYHMTNYCYRKVDEYGPENNAYWENRVMKHTIKEMVLVDKLVQLGES